MALHALLVVFSLAPVVYSFNCSIPPIYVDIHKRNVHESEFKQYGLFVGLGTPAQNFSMWPSLVHNETAFAFDDFCTPSSPSDCLNNTHGRFQTVLSPTWKAIPQFRPAEFGDTTNVSVEYGIDTMSLYTHYFETDPASATRCHQFPHLLLANSTSPNTSFFGPAGVLGLGQLSTNLAQLAANNAITSKSFGLYLGAGYDRAGGVINGSITYGGYDSGRFVGPVHNYTLAPIITTPTQSPLQVHVSQITIDSTNLGDGHLNLINDTGFAAEITTSQYALSLPQTVTDAFAAALSATPANNADNTLRLTRPFSGNLTITLSDGFQVSFPSEWVANVSAVTPIAAASGADTFALGAAFLQYVYLAVNYDSTPPAFHLARAVLEDAYVMPKPMCPNIAPAPYEQPPLNPFTKGGLVGAAIGGVVGGSVLTILAWALIQTYLRRRAAKKSVRFAAGKSLEMEEMEDVPQVASTPIKTDSMTGQRFIFRPPLTPGQPITPGARARSDFPFPSSSSEPKQRPAAISTLTMTFDPPPRVPFGEGKQPKNSRR